MNRRAKNREERARTVRPREKIRGTTRDGRTIGQVSTRERSIFLLVIATFRCSIADRGARARARATDSDDYRKLYIRSRPRARRHPRKLEKTIWIGSEPALVIRSTVKAARVCTYSRTCVPTHTIVRSLAGEKERERMIRRRERERETERGVLAHLLAR